ncbi:mis6 domain-containing protein [Phthorimaea operculella]|nr:mis6 domain-containing protein [Phthorimaea operculella]
MADVDDIIEFIKHLKKGFDKDFFQSKIEELAHVSETVGIESDDFHTLFKLWLNLSIPITKWVSLGACLVPLEPAEERTVDYAFRWLLANCEAHGNFSRMAFLLDWLTAAMDSNSIDMKALDSGYEIFYSLLFYELLTAHTLKLVYNLTKPSDVTRKRVIELLETAKKREAKKNMLRQIQVLLGLFKSYKPECVPEDKRRYSTTKEREHLMWINILNSEKGRNKKCEPLVPNMEFINLGSKQYSDREAEKNHLDFSDPVSLLQHSLQRRMSRPARLRALLCNQTGLALLALASHEEQAFLSHDLHHLLTNCFLESSPHTYLEKADLLQRLCLLQRTLLQGVPVVTRFLGQFLPFWNERDYFAEILGLVEWVTIDSPDQLQYIVDPLTRMYHRADPMEQCAILRALSNMYCNMVYSTTRKYQHFMNGRAQNHAHILPYVATSIADLCHKALQVNPDDMRVVHSTLMSVHKHCLHSLRHGAALPASPKVLTLAIPLVNTSAAGQDKIAALLIVYRKLFSLLKAANKHKDPSYVEQRKTLQSYTSDFVSCLYHEQALSGRKDGLVFDKLHPQVVSKLFDLVPNVDGIFSLRNSLAFAPYTYKTLEAVDATDVTNKLCLETVIGQTFPNLNEFLVGAVLELR